VIHLAYPFQGDIFAREGSKEMLQVDQITEVRMALVRGESMRSIAKRCGLSRNTVKKVALSGATEFIYKAREPSYPVLGPYTARLEALLAYEADQPRKGRRTVLQVYEELQSEGYPGSYDAVRRYAKNWRSEHTSRRSAFVPLLFGKGEAFQFDWSEENVDLGGVPMKVYVAQFRFCYSRMRFCIAFTRMSLEMVLAAHVAAHDFFGGLCGTGIYDNPKTVVTRIGKGKEREFNRRFGQLASHYLFEPTACTPKAGWEKGQVENQVKSLRQRVFTPRLRFDSLEELNVHLVEAMLHEAKQVRHPEFSEKTIGEVFAEEKPYLRVQAKAFDGYVCDERRASTECLVHYDRNMYSVPCAYAGRPVTVRAYAERIVLAFRGETIAEHRREFGKGHYALDPLHYVPLLERKPGALRNGRPFLTWKLPDGIVAIQEQLRRFRDWDRQMASILCAIPTYGLEVVNVACQTALEHGAISSTVVLNHLMRLTQDLPAPPVCPPNGLTLKHPPLADCRRYNALLRRLACSANIS
jgi:transposase